jgi:hypothetical protein
MPEWAWWLLVIFVIAPIALIMLEVLGIFAVSKLFN